ncbi:hypothetical protein N7468_005179 [Penicillium chermesinum]|uniref:NADH dehydrogenase [ubiquinone] 1 alpha subcomplex assembly factor 3 n=1 Tax=Penicillium chermesinum TaxID=63820 RepID=A0A9W9TN47_9EURO|nr:uncharacterized protein N7468_005179 [Penicillium chermesinum]KAJ5232223.1 hypothetical protein N7468_005179 [Penicillium chermesinum]
MQSPSPQLLRALRTSLSTPLCLSSPRMSSICSPTSTTRFTSLPPRRLNSSAIRPARIVPRSHSHKPASHDRGPESQEDTQTDFSNLDVLGNIPAPTTAIDACLDSGFHLNSGVKIQNGDGLLLVGGEAFRWRPWKTTESAEQGLAQARAGMINAKGQFEVDEEVWGLLSVVWPRPDILILGLGATMHPLSPETKRHINSLGIRVEIQDTRNAAAQFNLLATERGVNEVAAAMIPIGWQGRS